MQTNIFISIDYLFVNDLRKHKELLICYHICYHSVHEYC